MSWTTVPEHIINEDHTMRNHAILADCDQFTYKAMRLNLRSLADRHIFLNFNKWADENIVTDAATVHVDGPNHGDVVSKIDIYDVSLPELWYGHSSTP